MTSIPLHSLLKNLRTCLDCARSELRLLRWTFYIVQASPRSLYVCPPRCLFPMPCHRLTTARDEGQVCHKTPPENMHERTRYIDDYHTTREKPLSPLHGIPTSVKEHIGREQVRGWIKLRWKIPHDLQVLYCAGAISHARTSRSQSLMHLKTGCKLHKTTESRLIRTS